MTVQDELSTYLIFLGWSGTIDDMYRDQLVSVTGGEGCTQDLLRSFLSSKGFTGGISTALNQYLKSLGYTGSSNDMLLASYTNQDFFGALLVPVITVQPTNQSVSEGGSAVFSVTATVDEGAISYQWQVNTGGGWSDIGGATSSSYNTGATSLSQDGYLYRVVVTADMSGVGVTSNSVTLTVSVALDNYLSVLPNGYAQQAAARASADVVFEIVFRYTGATNAALFGTDTTPRWVLLSSSTKIYIQGDGSGVLEVNGTYTQGVWYKLSFSRTASISSCTVKRVDDNVVVGSGYDSTGTLGFLYLHYLARFLNSYAAIDFKTITWGSSAEPEQHKWVPQSSGTTWADTGTVGGWNFTLAGTPLPTWE